MKGDEGVELVNTGCSVKRFIEGEAMRGQLSIPIKELRGGDWSEFIDLRGKASRQGETEDV